MALKPWSTKSLSSLSRTRETNIANMSFESLNTVLHHEPFYSKLKRSLEPTATVLTIQPSELRWRIIGVCDRPCWSSRRRRHDDRKRCLRRRSDFYPRCTSWTSLLWRHTSFKNQNFLVKLWSTLQCRYLLRVLMANSITMIWFVWKSKIKVSEGHKLWGRVFIRNQESNLEPVCRETNFLCAVGASAPRPSLVNLFLIK